MNIFRHSVGIASAQRGYSLVEISVALAIIAVILVGGLMGTRHVLLTNSVNGQIRETSTIITKLQRQYAKQPNTVGASTAILAPLGIWPTERASAVNGVWTVRGVLSGSTEHVFSNDAAIGNWSFNQLDQVYLLFDRLGNGAAMSEGGRQKGLLVTRRGEFTFENPVIDPSNQGLAGIVALRETTHAWASATWARRDGQAPIAGHWNFDSHDLQGVARLGAQSVQAKDLQLSGKAQVQEASAQVMDINQLQVMNLKVPQAKRGAGCDPATGNLALDSFDGAMLTCDPTRLQWIRP